MNLEVINEADIQVSVKWREDKNSIAISPGGNANINYRITSVVAPSAIVYKVYEYGSDKSLLLNGQSELAVTPTVNNQPYKIVITKQGK